MKIYTYYQNINHSNQNELLELWKASWLRHGYEPVVLNLEDAKKNPYFYILDKGIRKFGIQLGNHRINDYGMSCWLRWLAYSMQVEEKIYVSDYDAININFPLQEPGDKLHLMDNDCPFFASGSPRQFRNLCKAFIEITNEKLETLKTQTNYRHDQEFFQYNLTEKYNPNCEELKNKYEILMTRNRLHIGGNYDPIAKKCQAGPHIGHLNPETHKVYHISHSNCRIIKKQYPDLFSKYSNQKLRVEIIKDLLCI